MGVEGTGVTFLVILVPSSCSSSATLSASYGGELGALESLWLSVTLSGALGARPGMKVRGEASGYAFKVYQRSRVGLTLRSSKLTGSLRSRRLAQGPVLIFHV